MGSVLLFGELVAQLPVVAIDFVLHTVVVRPFNGPGEFNGANKGRAERRFGDGHRHPSKPDNADVKNGGFSSLVESTGVNQRVGFIGVNPIIVHGDVKVPIFHGTVGAQPVGEFFTVAVVVKLFKFHLNFDVVVFTRVRRSFNGQHVTGEVKRLVHRRRHGDVFAEPVTARWRVDDNPAVVLQWRARPIEHLVQSTGGIDQPEAPLVVPAARNVRFRGRATGFGRVAENVANVFGREGVVGLQEAGNDAGNQRCGHAGTVLGIVLTVGERAFRLTGEGRAGGCCCRRDARTVGGHVGFEFVPFIVIAVNQARPPVGVGGHHVVRSVDRVAVVNGPDGNRTVSTGRRRDALGAVVAHGDHTDNAGVSGVVDQSSLCARTVVALVVGV